MGKYVIMPYAYGTAKHGWMLGNLKEGRCVAKQIIWYLILGN